MPTGYTAKIMENEQTFEDFILGCARAFGACITLRDEPFDTLIPDEFKPSDYYLNSVRRHEAELVWLEAMSNEERIQFGATTKTENIEKHRNYIARRKSEDERLSAMRQQVEAWEPPSDDHIELKRFMLQQIDVSMNGDDYWARALTEAENTGDYEYWSKAVGEARHGVVFARQEYKKELERTASRNRWIKQLRESLK